MIKHMISSQMLLEIHFWPSPYALETWFHSFFHSITGIFIFDKKQWYFDGFLVFLGFWHNFMLDFSLPCPQLLEFRNFWVYFFVVWPKKKDFRKGVVQMLCGPFFWVNEKYLLQKSLILGSVIHPRMPTCTTFKLQNICCYSPPPPLIVDLV